MRLSRKVASSGLACILICSAHAQDDAPLTLRGQNGSATLYGAVDVGYVNRWGGHNDGQGKANGFQSAAGSDGSRLGINFNYALFNDTKLIGALEYGVNPDGHRESGSAGKTFMTRKAFLGLAGSWGTLAGGKLDGSRATVLKNYDPFLGRSVGSAGSIQLVDARASNAIGYVTPAWQGLTLSVGYTANLYNVDKHSSKSPVWSARLDYEQGPLRMSYDHELEWWNSIPGYTRLTVNVLAASYAFSWITVSGFYDHTSVSRPFDVSGLGFYENHNGYMLGATMPVGSKGLVKMSWNRRDSAYTNNTCDKWSAGYQHHLIKSAYLYVDYSVINNGRSGTCTIAYTNEQTSVDSGNGDAGGKGRQGMDFGFVYQF